MPIENEIIDIVKLDHQGRGIGYLNNKIIFVKNALPDEKVKIKILKENSKYIEAEILEIVEKSENRIKSKCPFSKECGGCHLRHLSYDNTLKFKENKVKEIIKKYVNLEPKIDIIKNENKDFYRNKAEFKIVEGKVGFYKNSTHDLVEIERCLNVEEAINKFLFSIDLLNLKNAEVTIKTNYNGELIIIIKTEEENQINIEKLREKNKLVGIVFNEKTIYGSNNFIELIDNLLFKESYNSFFQVNRYITEKLFAIIKENINENDTILDLCSGVGTLSIVSSLKAKKVYGIEIVENSVKDAILNAKMNKRENIKFMLGDAFVLMDKIVDEINTIIIDPPRSGISSIGINEILKLSPQKIIYISCDPMTLSRDINLLKEKYEIEKFYILDMFSYTYHIENVVILKNKI